MYIMLRTNYIHLYITDDDDDNVRFVLDQYPELNFYCVNSLKQQSVGKHVTQLGHIILIPSQPVFALNYSLLLCAQERSNKYQLGI